MRFDASKIIHASNQSLGGWAVLLLVTFKVENHVNFHRCSAHLYHACCSDYNQQYVGSLESL